MPEDKLSFIPKKTFSSPVFKSKGAGFFAIFSFVVFLISLLLYGGLFFYRNDLNKQITLLSDSLLRSKASMDIPLINNLIQTSGKLTASKALLAQHRVITPIFDLLEENTLTEIRFKDFSFSVSKDTGPLVSMSGTAKSYSALAVQGEIFEGSKNIKSAVFSGLNLSDKGIVNFDVKLTLDPSTLIYKAE